MRFLGIDFSGATDAGKKIWIAEGVLVGDQIRVQHLLPAHQLENGTKNLKGALAALRAHIGNLGPATVGIDAPNSLPKQFDTGDWHAWVTNLTGTHSNAKTFKSSCTDRWVQLTQGRGKEGRRACDRTAGTPWSAWNERLYRQTWNVLTEIYAPLVTAGLVTVAPFQAPDPTKARLAEICPASTLKRLGLYKESYKDTRADQHEQRSSVLATLQERANLRMTDQLKQHAIENRGGDALDALIALAATVRCRDQINQHDPTSEGRVYDWA